MKQKNISFFIVTGMSGAGKTQALKCFEDIGFFCADNLPVQMIPEFTKIVISANHKLTGIALGIDIRTALNPSVKSLPKFRHLLINSLQKVKNMGINPKIVFMDADNSTLIKRFSETRRKHPVMGKDLYVSIKKERKGLQQIITLSDKIINTANSTLGELKSLISGIADIKFKNEIVINIIAFGYKYGIPLDSDIVFDVRFLPNPNYVAKLQCLTGNSVKVEKYVMKFNITRQFLQLFFDLISFMLPNCIKEGKSYLSIAVGCTGGKHRSVVISNCLNRYLRKNGYAVRMSYRDIEK